MADYLIQDTTLDAIADAINAKTGGSSAMTPAQMVTEIGNIETGGGNPVIKGSITYPSGNFFGTITHNAGYDNYLFIIAIDEDDFESIKAQTSNTNNYSVFGAVISAPFANFISSKPTKRFMTLKFKPSTGAYAGDYWLGTTVPCTNNAVTIPTNYGAFNVKYNWWVIPISDYSPV